MEMRQLGRTGLTVSCISIGTIPIRRPAEEDAVRVLRHALDSGINYIDTARGYTRSEERVAKAIEGRRDQCVIGSKAGAKTKDEMLSAVDESLRVLGTDYIDIYKHHGICQADELAEVMGPGGAMEGLVAAREQGKIGYTGISGHNPDVLMDAVRTGEMDVILVPFNFVKREPADELLPLCEELGVGVTIMKPLGGSLFASHADLALRWVLQHAVSTIPVGMWRTVEVDWNTAVGRNPTPLTADEDAAVADMAATWDRQYCRLCYRHSKCPHGVDIDGLMLTELMVRRHGLAELVGERDFGATLSKAEQCSTCGDRAACAASCPFELDIPGLLSAASDRYLPIMAAYAKDHAP
jgi:predicted aldo/keto reductase-like oxidoreductase